MKQANTLPEILRHAADIVENGDSLDGAFEYQSSGEWIPARGGYLPSFLNVQKWRIADQDQHLLDDGWIRHTGDVCPVHPKDIVRVMGSGGESIFAPTRAELWVWTSGTEITHYKVIKTYVEPTTFVLDGVTLNRPYKSAPIGVEL